MLTGRTAVFKNSLDATRSFPNRKTPTPLSAASAICARPEAPDCAGTLGCTGLARQQDTQWQEGPDAEAWDRLQTLYSYIKFSVTLYVVALSSLVIYK